MASIIKPKGVQATELETKVSKLISSLDARDLDLKALNLTAVKEVELTEGKKALVLFVPFRQYKKFRKVHSTLTQELEKKLENTQIVIIPQRVILSDAMARYTGQKRSHTRTLTAVNNAVLHDVVFPTTIVGKRIRYKADGSQLLKVFLDGRSFKDAEDRLATYAAVYRRLTSRNVEFLFQ